MSNALATIAQSTGVTQEEVTDVLRGMIISAKNQHGAAASNAEMAIVSSVCAKYDLNPLVKEVAAFVSGGKLQMVVMIDGWYRIVNRQPDFDGVEFEDKFDEKGALISTTCKMYLKSRSRPVCVTEYMAECRDDKSSVWRKWPARMLRHKAYIQAARMAFGLSDIIDDDEASRIRGNRTERDITPQQQAPEINWQEVESRLAECGDIETLQSTAGQIRDELQKNNAWESAKAQMVLLHSKHKARIESYVESEIESNDAIEGEVEFDEDDGNEN